MIDRGCHSVLGVNIHAVDYEAAVKKIIAAALARRPYAVSALAVHGVMTGVGDIRHRHRLNQLDLVVPDGQPVRWALNLLHHTKLPDRVYGPTLAMKVCQEAAQQQLPIYLYGSRREVLDALIGNLLRRFSGLQIAGAEPSRFRQLSDEEKHHTVERIKASGANIVLVGLGCPRQEVWAYEYSLALSMPIMAVGAAFDFYAGLLKQAPLVLRKLGLEWAFRLMCEPRRLWRRYLYLNPWYVCCLLLQFSQLKRYDTQNTEAPTKNMNYG